MVGYIGERARRKKRNIIIFFIFLIIFLISIYIIPVFRLNETIPSDTLLPSEGEITSPQINTDVEELELKIFDKEQKIIFRNKQIEKLKGEIKILVTENEQLSKSVLDLNNKINSSSNQNEDVVKLNSQIKKIKTDTQKELKKLNTIIKDLTNEKNALIRTKNKDNNENDILKKEYKSEVSKNLKLNELKEDFLNKIRELESLIEEKENLIEEQNLIIKILEDTSHHG